MFFLREGGVHLGLVVEGVGGRLGLVLVVICLRLHIPLRTLGFELYRQETSVAECV